MNEGLCGTLFANNHFCFFVGISQPSGFVSALGSRPRVLAPCGGQCAAAALFVRKRMCGVGWFGTRWEGYRCAHPAAHLMFLSCVPSSSRWSGLVLFWESVGGLGACPGGAACGYPQQSCPTASALLALPSFTSTSWWLHPYPSSAFLEHALHTRLQGAVGCQRSMVTVCASSCRRVRTLLLRCGWALQAPGSTPPPRALASKPCPRKPPCLLCP